MLAFCKISENRHTFARLRYVKEDGLPAFYSPDFLVRTADAVYLAETKAQQKTAHPNVQRKLKAALAWCERINTLTPTQRGGPPWHYVLLAENMVYEWQAKGARLAELLDYARLRKIADDNGAYLIADTPQISGSAAAGVVPSPFEHCHVEETEPHKTLRGCRAGMIFYRKGVRSLPRRGVELGVLALLGEPAHPPPHLRPAVCGRAVRGSRGAPLALQHWRLPHARPAGELLLSGLHRRRL